MPNPFELDMPPRRVMNLMFVVDTSGSMCGNKIASLNTAVREALTDVGEISHNNGDAQIKIAALQFSNDAQWMYPTPIDAEDFQWQDLKADGLTNFGDALKQLNNKLSRSHGFMAEPTGSRPPAIILLSDGEPTSQFEEELEKLKQNPWFNVAIKIAIAIGDDANKDMLAKFTGNIEAVITVHNVNQLKKVIRTASSLSSTFGSRSTKVGEGENTDEGNNKEIVDSIIDGIKDDNDLDGVDFGDSTNNSGSDDWGDW